MTQTPNEPGPSADEPRRHPDSAPEPEPAAAGRGSYSGEPAYGTAPAGYGAAVGPPRNGLGIAALILGILAVLGSVTVVLGLLFGLLAIVLGFVGRGRAKRREATNGGVALTGAILGIVGLLLSIVLVAVGATFLSRHKSEVQQYRDCLNKAGSNSAAVQQCQQQFANQVAK
ncbi:MAG: DUF4190 domain-containing protein [Actinomycetota bacterium]|nr:DUF4190 domain-containing protein [Actinomycetota bacterium]